MKVFQLTAEPRTDLGKKATKALRAEGTVSYTHLTLPTTSRV